MEKFLNWTILETSILSRTESAKFELLEITGYKVFFKYIPDDFVNIQCEMKKLQQCQQS